MTRYQCFLALTVFIHFFSSSLSAQLNPVEESELNYRLIGFRFPYEANATNYSIEVAYGDINTSDSFSTHIFTTVHLLHDHSEILLPSFGKKYTWRVVYTISHKSTYYSALHHFSILNNNTTDTSQFRLVVTENSGKYDNSFLLLDANKAMYDMKGQPIWFLHGFENESIRDLKITSRGTITFLAGDQAYETDYNAHILWKAPDNGRVSGDKKEYYHHEFTRLANGHYMVLGSENVFCNKTAVTTGDSIWTIIPQASKSSKSVAFKLGTIIEYDKSGKIVWFWKMSQYFGHSDLIRYKINDSAAFDVHENAFFFDEQSDNIYLSCKGLNRIIKIKYPEGKVIANYTPESVRGVKESDIKTFCNQHSCNVSPQGQLYFFNNNSCNYPLLPTIVYFQQSPTNDTLEKTWEYQCTFDMEKLGKSYGANTTSGGNVTELPDQSVFTSMSAPYSKLFIVSKDKKIQWSAIPEKWNESNQKWELLFQYRASINTDKELFEKLIWCQ